MAKRYFLISFLLIAGTQLKAQQYGLFNTKTLFDAFENPGQKAFVLDSSRQYASNFLLPNFNLSAVNKGDAGYPLKMFAKNRILNSENNLNAINVPIGQNKLNKASASSNIYLLTFRIFKNYKYQKELGFAWQVRTDAYANYTNETIVALDDINRFTSPQKNLLNGNGYAQSYHQFSITYRENFNKALAFGAKISLLSGIAYANGEISKSELIGPITDKANIKVVTDYKSNVLFKDDVNAMPNFKNPGMSISFGTTYTTSAGFFIMANIKDLGFIKWSNESHDIHVDDYLSLRRGPLIPNYEIAKQLRYLITQNDQLKGFYTATNAKADFLISKTFGFYTPNFIVSKNLIYKGGDVVLVNNFKYNEFSAALSPTYNMLGFGMLGAQGMYQTPNFEFFAGTDNLLMSAKLPFTGQGIGSQLTGASFYMGLGIKFGYTVEHPQNSSYMPGLSGRPYNEKSFFSRIFAFFRGY